MDEPHNPTEMEIADSKLTAELKKWDVLGVLIADLPTNGGQVHMSLRIDTINELLIEKGIYTREESDLKMKQTSVKTLEVMRKEIEPRVAAAKLEAIKNGRLGPIQ